MTVTNVLIAGVGGQGAVLASELLALAAAAAGKDVKQGEFHGVAQRGGAVFSHVRFGDRVHAPMARRGAVDFLLALEKLEALRYAHFVKPGGTIFVDDFKVEPLRTADERPYPDDAIDFLRSKGFEVVVVGHTDDRPVTRSETKAKHPTNWHLSAHRAIAVANILWKNGYQSSRVGVMGCGEYRPAADNSTEAGRGQNRRVEIYLIPTGSVVRGAYGWRAPGEKLAFSRIVR